MGTWEKRKRGRFIFPDEEKSLLFHPRGYGEKQRLLLYPSIGPSGR